MAVIIGPRTRIIIFTTVKVDWPPLQRHFRYESSIFFPWKALGSVVRFCEDHSQVEHKCVRKKSKVDQNRNLWLKDHELKWIKNLRSEIHEKTKCTLELFSGGRTWAYFIDSISWSKYPSGDEWFFILFLICKIFTLQITKTKMLYICFLIEEFLFTAS